MSWKSTFVDTLEEAGGKVTKGMLSHYRRLTKENSYHTCEKCELSIGKYPGRYPKFCPNCGVDLTTQEAYPSKTMREPTDQSDLEEVLGTARREMPQIRSDKVPEFLGWLNKKGVPHSRTKTEARSIKPTQKELNKSKIEAKKRLGVKKLSEKPVLVSSDNHLLDGHHRWAAIKALDPSAKLDAVRIGSPIRSLLPLAREWPGAFYKAAHEATAGLPLEDRVRLWASVDNVCEAVHAALGLPMVPWTRNNRAITCEAIENGKAIFSVTAPCWEAECRVVGRLDVDLDHISEEILQEDVKAALAHYYTHTESATPLPRTLDELFGHDNLDPVGANDRRGSSLDDDEDVEEKGMPKGAYWTRHKGKKGRPAGKTPWGSDTQHSGKDLKGHLKDIRDKDAKKKEKDEAGPLIGTGNPGDQGAAGGAGLPIGPSGSKGSKHEVVTPGADVPADDRRPGSDQDPHGGAPSGNKVELHPSKSGPAYGGEEEDIDELIDGLPWNVGPQRRPKWAEAFAEDIGIDPNSLSESLFMVQDLRATARAAAEQADGVNRGEHPDDGTKDFVAAVGIVVKDGREILLGQSSDKVDDDRAGKWTFPGGGIDPEDGNDPVAAAIRETREEFGVQTISTGTVLTTPEKPGVAFVVLTYLRGEPTPNEEFSNYVWMPYSARNDFPGLYAPNRAVLEQVPPGLLRENEIQDLVAQAKALVEKQMKGKQPPVSRGPVAQGEPAPPPERSKPGTSMKAPEKDRPVEPELSKPLKQPTLTPPGDSEELQKAAQDDQEQDDEDQEQGDQKPQGPSPDSKAKDARLDKWSKTMKKVAGDDQKKVAPDGEPPPSDEPEKKADAAMAQQASDKAKPAAPPPQQAAPGEPDPNELAMGVEIEKEHTPDPAQAEQIAREHLAKDPQYYSKMKQAGIAQQPQDPNGQPPQQDPNGNGQPPPQQDPNGQQAQQDPNGDPKAAPGDQGQVPAQPGTTPPQPGQPPQQDPNGNGQPQDPNGNGQPQDPNGNGLPDQPGQAPGQAQPEAPFTPGQQPPQPGAQAAPGQGPPGAPGAVPGQAPGAGAPTQTVDLVFGEPESAQNAYDWLQALKLNNVSQDGTTLRLMVAGPAEMMIAQRVAQAFGLELSGIS